MNFSKRRLWLFGAIALGAIVLLTLFSAPANDKFNSGSTYNRAPEGYGAWYAFMEKRGTPLNRWRKPFQALTNSKDTKPSVTLLRVNSSLIPPGLFKDERDWVEKGNTLVILGVRQPVTEAPFSTRHQVEAGSVKIDTGRRNQKAEERLLGDRFGAIVWQESIGKGQVIYATTPYLAANAYQGFQGNYEFLAQLVTQNKQPVWVDEYIHGYKDPAANACNGKNSRSSQNDDKNSTGITCEEEQSLVGYLANTALFPAFVQGLILLLVAIWALNRRFGKPLTLSAPVVNNSEAYIQALAGVLQKAESSEFVLEVLGKEEQLQLQKALFLGQESLDHQSLVNAWVQQTGRPATELEQVLQMQSRKRRISETDLLTWLGKWEQIRRHLPS